MRVRRDLKIYKKLYTTWWQETTKQKTRAKRWVEVHFPRSEMRIDPRNDQTNQPTNSETKTTKHKNGAGARRNQHKLATSRSDGNSETITADKHICKRWRIKKRRVQKRQLADR